MSNALPCTQPNPAPWWRGATIYQIYPRSFADSNGDGIGDLPGITAQLSHVASLGVDAIWVSPFFTSPMHDFGYDIADYCDVDPVFGTLADFDAVVARAHSLGLRVMVDQVYSHTSDAHAWFAESRADRTNARADWYVWADAKADGSPPTNWQSVFGGPAWTWDARRCQYYMHNFLSAQPQLNVHLLSVQDALLDVMRFWLDRGVDGFRLDALNFAMHDCQLRDNPAAIDNGPRTRPFDYQQHIHNQSQPEVLGFLERIRALADGYGAFTLAEVGGASAIGEMKAYTAPGRLDSAYGFDFLYASALDPRTVADAITAWGDDGWPSWAFANHDAPRAVSRWAPPEQADICARAAMLLLLCLRGNAIVWQGEELALRQVDIGFDDLRDPEAIANWPLTLSRDGTRTPLPWAADAPSAGFSTVEPWLPIGAANAPLAVDRQEADAASMLHLTRRLVALRQASQALREGSMKIVEVGAKRLVFERRVTGECLLCAFNLGGPDEDWSPPSGDKWRVRVAVGDAQPGLLPTWGALVLEIIT